MSSPSWIADLDQKKLGISGKIAAGKSTFLKNAQAYLKSKSITPIVEEEKVEQPLLQAYIDSVTAANNAIKQAEEIAGRFPPTCSGLLEQMKLQEITIQTLEADEDLNQLLLPLLKQYDASLRALRAAKTHMCHMASNFQTERAISCYHRQEIVMTKRQAFKNNHVALVERPLYENLCFAKANQRCDSLPHRYVEAFYEPMLALKNNYPCDLIIYLHVSDRRSVQNQAVRARAGEDDYVSEYLAVLGDEYFNFVLEHVERGKMLVVDWSNFGSVEDVLKLAADVLSGRKPLPVVRRIDCSSDDELVSSAGITKIISVDGEETIVVSQPTTRKKGYHDRIIKELGAFHDVEIYI